MKALDSFLTRCMVARLSNSRLHLKLSGKLRVNRPTILRANSVDIFILATLLSLPKICWVNESCKPLRVRGKLSTSILILSCRETAGLASLRGKEEFAYCYALLAYFYQCMPYTSSYQKSMIPGIERCVISRIP